MNPHLNTSATTPPTEVPVNPSLPKNGIRFSCPRGHILVARAEVAGKTLPCPKCGEVVKVPAADSKIEQILEALFDEKMDRARINAVAEFYRTPRTASGAKKNLRRCPKCRRLNPVNYRVCVNCHAQLSIEP